MPARRARLLNTKENSLTWARPAETIQHICREDGGRIAESTATAMMNCDGGGDGGRSERMELKIKRKRERVPHLHDNQSQRENQQNGEFIQHKRGEDVETWSDKRTKSVTSHSGVF